MKFKLILTILLLPLTNFLFGQKTFCNCQESFNELYTYIETNYAGWDIKINANTKRNFEKFTKEIRSKTEFATNEIDCFFAVNEWVNYFKDGHLQVSPKKVLDSLSHEKIDLNESQIKYLTTLKKPKSLEGIWKNTRNDLKVAIVKSKNKNRLYDAIVLESNNPSFKKGSLKLSLLNSKNQAFMIWGNLNYSIIEYTVENNNKIVIGDNWFTLVRDDVKNEIEPKNNNNFPYTFKKLDNETLLITLPTFVLNSSTSPIDSFYNAHEKELATHKYLIIDIRNNPGGSSDGFMPLRKFYYTNPIKFDGYVPYMTKENSPFWVSEYEWINNIDRNADFFKSPNYQKQFLSAEKDAEIIKTNFGNGKSIPLTDDITILDSISTFPQKIAVITNRGCASTAEWFALDVKQSKKVTVYGQPTKGIIDYVKIRERNLKCDRFSLLLSIGKRTIHLPEQAIDNIGVQPDVLLTNIKTDWVEYIKQDLKKR